MRFESFCLISLKSLLESFDPKLYKLYLITLLRVERHLWVEIGLFITIQNVSKARKYVEFNDLQVWQKQYFEIFNCYYFSLTDRLFVSLAAIDLIF